MVKRKGNQPKPEYVTSWGEVVHGAYLSADGRLRPTGRSSPAFGPASDERLAVHRFKQWRAKQGTTLDPETQAVNDFMLMGTSAYSAVHLNPETLLADPMAMEIFKQHFRTLILNNPKKAAIELDIDFLAWYPSKPDKPEHTLAELGRHYVENKRNTNGAPLSKPYQEDFLREWDYFLSFVKGATYARDISRDQIQAYHKAVMNAFDKGKSPSWVRSKFKTVKAVFQYGLDYSKDKADYRQALDECGILRVPSDTVNPKPISVDDYHTLLNYSQTTQDKAILLLGLNMMGHSGEVGKVKKTEIDLDKGTLSCRRSKNGYPRVAKLWDRTIEAIRHYQKEKPHHSEYVFVNEDGAPMNGETIRQRIARTRKRAQRDGVNIADDVTFEGIRDGAITVAETIEPHWVKYICGHKTGMKDRYALRQPTNPKVIECCNAVERHYFG